MTWADDAECRGMDPQLFDRATEEARNACRRCAVRSECLEDALAYTHQQGLRGNTTAQFRRSLIRHRRYVRRSSSG